MADKWRTQFGGSTASSSPSQISDAHVSGSGQMGSFELEESIASLQAATPGHSNTPAADLLYASTVDCGDKPGTEHTSLDLVTGKTVRNVSSGLNGWIPLSEQQERRAVVVATYFSWYNILP
ncbi:hypothetical protein KXW88_000355 [Aspergillus fumigatus]|nr:hypothetical protein KXW88_000355 [Aspergillus fumigatus]